jgi:polyhydroxyalkanoate synthesis regulator phasin
VAQTSAGTGQKPGARNAKAQVKTQSKALVTRLTDAGEEALQRLADLPGGQRALGAMNELRARVDELGKKVRGIEELERRITRLEKQVADLKPPRRAASTRSSTRRSSTRSSS